MQNFVIMEFVKRGIHCICIQCIALVVLLTKSTPPHSIWSEEEKGEEEGMIKWSGRMKRMIILFRKQDFWNLFYRVLLSNKGRKQPDTEKA